MNLTLICATRLHFFSPTGRIGGAYLLLFFNCEMLYGENVPSVSAHSATRPVFTHAERICAEVGDCRSTRVSTFRTAATWAAAYLRAHPLQDLEAAPPELLVLIRVYAHSEGGRTVKHYVTHQNIRFKKSSEATFGWFFCVCLGTFWYV